MTPSEKLHAHHEKLIGTIRSLADRVSGDPSEASLLLSYCEEYLVSHAEAEEVTLYTADDDAAFVNGMIREHKDIKHSLDAIDSAFTRGDTGALLIEIRNFMNLLDSHFVSEEKVLVPRLKAKLNDEELESLISEAHQIESEKKGSDVWSLFENDHKRIDLNIARLRGAVGHLEDAKGHYSKARKQLLKHIELEETALFPSFENYARQEQMGPIGVMISEHREITSIISVPEDKVEPGSTLRSVDDLIARLAVHNKKEELILYPMINRTLPRDVKAKLFKECFEGFAAV